MDDRDGPTDIHIHICIYIYTYTHIHIYMKIVQLNPPKAVKKEEGRQRVV
jgi:hypothetical protein